MVSTAGAGVGSSSAFVIDLGTACMKSLIILNLGCPVYPLGFLKSWGHTIFKST